LGAKVIFAKHAIANKTEENTHIFSMCAEQLDLHLVGVPKTSRVFLRTIPRLSRCGQAK
jgi:hypothetical protein